MTGTPSKGMVAWRLLLLGASLLLVAIASPWPDVVRLLILRFTADEKIVALDANEDVRKAIEERIDLSKTLFQATLVVLAGIWSLILAKREEAKIIFHDGLAIFMFGCANLMLLFAGASHIQFVIDLTSIMILSSKLGKIPDIDSAFVFSSLTSQLIRICLALVVTGLMILCAHWKKEQLA